MVNKDTYKRLTYRFNKGIGYIDNDFNGVYYSDCINGDSGCITKIYERLVELEDKIENGTLVEFPRIIHPNEREWFVYFQLPTGIIDYDILYSQFKAEARLKELQEKKE